MGVKQWQALWLCVTTALASAAPLAELRVRDTSFYAGTPFNFYVHVEGTKKAPQPRLFESDKVQIRYVGSAPSTRSGEEAITFTYEAVPLSGGKVELPGGVVTVDGEELEIAPVEVEVGTPRKTDKMAVEVSVSQNECYVGEPVVLTFSWVSNLSLNGVKALDIRVPAMTDHHFRVREARDPVDPDAANAIGVPVSNQRVISEFWEAERNGEAATRIGFQKVLVPLSAGDLTLPPATLLCSFSPPRDEKFKGARYPSYFNNEFFEQDLVGEFERLMVESEPLKIKIKPLPQSGKPENFSGIIGAFELRGDVEPKIAAVSDPMTLRLEALGLPFPHVTLLPPLEEQEGLARSFLIPEERARPSLEGDAAIYTQTIRPVREAVKVVPSIEVSYFDPVSASYGLAKTEPISVTITPSTAVNAYDAAFSDGSKLKNEIQRKEGGIYFSYAGDDLLQSRPGASWIASVVFWSGVLVLPPLMFLGLMFVTKEWRFARVNPDEARRRRAFRKFKRSLGRLGRNADAPELARVMRRYLAERFDWPECEASADQVRQLLKRCDVDDEEARLLANALAVTDASRFSGHEIGDTSLPKHRVLRIVGRVEQHAVRAGVLLFTLAAGAGWGAEKSPPGDVLSEAQTFFQEANEAALSEPGKSQELYQLAADRYETLLDDFDIQNGKLYYNLANAHFLAGNIGEAILNYRRAQIFRPLDRHVSESLRYARTQRVDVIADHGWPAVWRRVFFWHFYLGQGTRAVIEIALYAALWGVMVATLFLPAPWRWKALGWLAAGIVLVGGSMAIHASRSPDTEAVILDREVTARKGDAYVYDPAFTNALHAGTEVRILEQRRDWLHVRLEDGNTGWIPSASAERVR